MDCATLGAVNRLLRGDKIAALYVFLDSMPA
jgi:hypothetical protein